MKKLFLTTISALITLFACAEGTSTTPQTCAVDDPQQILMINDSTLLYKNVDKIQIIANDSTVVKVYDSWGNVIYSQKGSFTLPLPEGDYKLESNKIFTQARYKKQEVLFRY